jgi:hypothetical protein
MGAGDAANVAGERLRRGFGCSRPIILRAFDGTTLLQRAMAKPPPREPIFQATPTERNRSCKSTQRAQATS